MKRFIKILLGFNAVSAIQLIRLKPRLFLRACSSAFAASREVDVREGNKIRASEFSQIPEISLGEIMGDRRPSIRLSIMRYESGMLPNEQAMALLSILVAEAPDEVLEIGTFMGNTTLRIAENLEKVTVHTVDLPETFSVEGDEERNIPKDDFHLVARRVVGKEFKEHPCASRIVQHFADTAKWDFQDAGHPTFFFIDGSHTYEYCKNDSEKCFELCRGRGVFLWHDCDEGHPGVVKFIAEWRRLGRDIKRIGGTTIAYWKSV